MSDTPNTPRLRHREDELVPVFMVRAMFALVVVCLVLVSAARITGRPLESTPPDGAILKERLIYLSGDTSGAARVLDVDGALIADLPGEQGGFIAGIERVIARERLKYGLPNDRPVLLQLREGNRLSITDPLTGWSAELMGFGITNTRSFARLLDQP